MPRVSVICSGSQEVWKSQDFPLSLTLVLHRWASYVLLFKTLESKPAPNLLTLMKFFSININRYWVKTQCGSGVRTAMKQKKQKIKEFWKALFLNEI